MTFLQVGVLQLVGYADDTAVLFPTSQELDAGVPKVMAHFAKWGMEVHYGSRATNPVKESKTEILFVQSLPSFMKTL